MTDPTRLRDHARGCEGRNYSCTCGYDDEIAEERDALRAERGVEALVEALRRSKQGWENVLELQLMPTTHRANIEELIDDARAALAQMGGG